MQEVIYIAMVWGFLKNVEMSYEIVSYVLIYIAWYTIKSIAK